MAREDLLAQLLRTIVEKEGPPPPDDNTLIQKMIAPYDFAQLSDDPTLSVSDVINFVWGGTNVIAGWKWGQGQWLDGILWSYMNGTWSDYSSKQFNQL